MDFSTKINEYEKFFAAEVAKRKKSSENAMLNSRLQEDLSLSRNIESYLRTQLEAAQNRIILLHKDLNELTSILRDKVSKQDDIIQKQLAALAELQATIQDLRKKVSEKLTQTIAEKEMASKIEGLKQELKQMDSNYHLLRMEHQVTVKEKDLRIKELEDKASNAEKAASAELNRSHMTYKNKIADLELKNKVLETNLNNLKGGTGVQSRAPFEPSTEINKEIRSMWDKKINVTWADAARKAAAQSKLQSERSSGALQHNEVSSIGNSDSGKIAEPTELQETRRAISPEQGTSKPSYQFKPKFRMPRSNLVVPIIKDPVFGSKVQPLQVQAVRDESQPKKKRLYSSNNNHFLE